MKMIDVPFRLLFSVVIGFFVGRFIDNILSLEVPVFTMIFSALGLVGGIWSCIKRLS